MRFIGNKTALLENIEDFINENIPYYEDMIFCDIFSGTASVARYFKKDYQIISNDLLFFSYVLQRATIDNNDFPILDNLKNELNVNNYYDIVNYLENTSTDILQIQHNIKDEESPISIFDIINEYGDSIPSFKSETVSAFADTIFWSISTRQISVPETV